MKIVLFGDSITDMNRVREVDEHVLGYGMGYSMFVTEQLVFENPEKYHVLNRGIGGNRVVDLYARIKADVWNYNPDVLSILIGVNDVWHEVSSKNGVELDRYERVYRMLIEDTLAALPNIKIMLCEPFVLKGECTRERYDEFLEVKKYAKVVEKLAKEYGLPFVPLQEKMDEAAERYGVETCLYDGVHPNVYGAKIIANQWLSVFKNQIDK